MSSDPSVADMDFQDEEHAAQQQAAGTQKKPSGGEFAQPPAGAVAPATAADPFSDQMYAFGQRMGLSKEQVKSFGTPQSFDNWARGMTLQIQQQRDTHARSERQKWEKEQADARAAQQQAATNKKEPLGKFAFKDASLYEPEMVAFVEHQNARFEELQQQYNERLQQMQQQFEPLTAMSGEFRQFQQQQREQQTQQVIQNFDKILAETDAELFGTDPVHKLAPTSAEFDNRRQLSEYVSRLEAGYLARGEVLPPLDQLVKTGYRAVFGEKIASRALAGASAKSAKLRGQTVAPPSTREPNLSPTERATKAARDKMREFGPAYEEEMASIPD